MIEVAARHVVEYMEDELSTTCQSFSTAWK